MLIVGGLGSLAGAVVGVMLVTLTTGSLRLLENGITLGTVAIQLPRGLQELGLGIFMVLALILRPTGIMNGSELPFPRGAKMERSRCGLDRRGGIEPSWDFIKEQEGCS
jgi:branched-chain amino acid transport system permease protein